MTTAKKTRKASKRIKADLVPKDVKGQESDRVKGGSKLIQAKNDTKKGLIANFRV
jgi:hypothetical protein